MSPPDRRTLERRIAAAERARRQRPEPDPAAVPVDWREMAREHMRRERRIHNEARPLRPARRQGG